MKYEKKVYTLTGIMVLNLIFISCQEKEISNLNRKEIRSDSTVLVSNKSVYNLEIDSSILRTDDEGNILGGDMKDWNFNENNYKEIHKYNFMFWSPLRNYEVRPAVGFIDDPFTAEIHSNKVILKWITSTEIDNKGFYVERTENYAHGNAEWMEIGFVKGSGNSQEERKYKFVDKDVKIGSTYYYRLKQVTFKDEINYHPLPREVFVMKYPDKLQFYPAYPNPVSDKVTVSFYVPKKDIVSLYFLNGKDTTYILDREPQGRGFYKLTVDKKIMGFENEIKRLYINCKTCNKKKNFGDIQF